MSATRVPSYPRWANTSAAARSRRWRVSAAVTPGMRPIDRIKRTFLRFVKRAGDAQGLRWVRAAADWQPANRRLPVRRGPLGQGRRGGVKAWGGSGEASWIRDGGAGWGVGGSGRLAGSGMGDAGRVLAGRDRCYEVGGLVEGAVGGGYEAGQEGEAVPHAGPSGVGDLGADGVGAGGKRRCVGSQEVVRGGLDQQGREAVVGGAEGGDPGVGPGGGVGVGGGAGPQPG